MPHPDYFKVLLNAVRRPAMYGLQDAMDLDIFLCGYRLGANVPELDRLLRNFIDFLKTVRPEFEESTCGWSHIVKAHSWERGGSMRLFRMWLGRMLHEQGHWTDEHYETFISEKPVSEEAWQSLPPPRYA
jgi:hypothetical protein